MTYIDTFNDRAEESWTSFIQNDGIVVRISPKDLKKEIEDDLDRIMGIIRSGLPCTATVCGDKSGLTPEELDLINRKNLGNNNILNDSNFLLAMSKIKYGAANYFIVNDPGYGAICSKCNSGSYIVLIMDEEYLDLKDKVFVPCAETYYVRRIMPNSEDFVRVFPVPVNIKKDYWYCPTCKELHKFLHYGETSYGYNMEVVYP